MTSRSMPTTSAVLSLFSKVAHHKDFFASIAFNEVPLPLIERDFSRTPVTAALSKIRQNKAALGKTKDLLGS